jgi:hypothetical protein
MMHTVRRVHRLAAGYALIFIALPAPSTHVEPTSPQNAGIETAATAIGDAVLTAEAKQARGDFLVRLRARSYRKLRRPRSRPNATCRPRTTVHHRCRWLTQQAQAR